MFVLDRYDRVYAEEVFKRWPEIKESLTDFTFYDNVIGSYSRTFPSINYLLNGVEAVSYTHLLKNISVRC